MPAVAQMVVCREVDGHTDTLLVTDSTWEASPGFRSYTDSWQPLHFGGERFDPCRKTAWRPAAVVRLPQMRVTPQEFEGNRIVDVLFPQSVQPQLDGTVMVDFGRVVTGWLHVDFFPQGSYR